MGFIRPVCQFRRAPAAGRIRPPRKDKVNREQNECADPVPPDSRAMRQGRRAALVLDNGFCSFVAGHREATYRERVNADERDEISASVAAHAELGPRYDTAVAEGLVERIGEEIDKRIDARIGGRSWPGPPGQVQSAPAQSAPVRPEPAQPPAYRGPAAPTPSMPAASPPPPAVPRRSNGVTGMILGLGSMGLGVGATAVVVAHHPNGAAAVLMVLLIWAAIALINIAHSRRI